MFTSFTSIVMYNRICFFKEEKALKSINLKHLTYLSNENIDHLNTLPPKNLI